ncbi:hypothetical protein [Streptomyces rochei]|uniref:hypothetical protein n=1 Tax=Streptomyces rochei TaxID=1928 RepID=UPI00363347D1
MTDMMTAGSNEPQAGKDAEPWRLTASFLDSCLQSAGSSFEDGELAYLALTSQIENPVRDRVAYAMHRRLKGTRLGVGREWTGLFTTGKSGKPARRSVDLAVVEKPRRRSRRVPQPHGVVEFKAFYAHDAREPHQFNHIDRQVREDVEKSLTWEWAIMGEVFAVVLLPELRVVNERRIPHQIMRKIEDNVVTYDFLRSTGVVPDGRPVQEVSSRLALLGPVSHGVIDAGTEDGVHVTVPYVILGPVPVETFECMPPPRQE